MKYVKVLIILLVFCCKALGQQKEILAVTLSKDETTKDDCCGYVMSIKNESDSALCILHSMFMNLTSENPQGLALYSQGKKSEEYSFQYSFKDTVYTFEVVPYVGELILPYQKLVFKIRVLPSNGDKVKHLSFEYLYLKDFSYREFMEEMKKVGSWYYKYTRMKKSIDLPN